MKTAIVIGGTGLVGNALVQLLLDDVRFDSVLLLGRRTTGISHSKLQEHLIDFDKPQLWKHLVKGDILFSCLGTTLKQAGSKDAQYRVDYKYQFNVASEAAENDVPAYILVSSIGAGSSTRFFYTRMKGQLEDGVSGLPFTQIGIVRPGPLYGNRRNNRPGEIISVPLLKALNVIGLFKKYTPISAEEVGKAMIGIAMSEKPGVTIYENDQLLQLAGK